MSIKFSEDHEWIQSQGDDLVVIGITDFAQEQLGDLVYVELPKLGEILAPGENISKLKKFKVSQIMFYQFSGLLFVFTCH